MGLPLGVGCLFRLFTQSHPIPAFYGTSCCFIKRAAVCASMVQPWFMLTCFCASLCTWVKWNTHEYLTMREWEDEWCIGLMGVALLFQLSSLTVVSWAGLCVCLFIILCSCYLKGANKTVDVSQWVQAVMYTRSSFYRASCSCNWMDLL